MSTTSLPPLHGQNLVEMVSRYVSGEDNLKLHERLGGDWRAYSDAYQQNIGQYGLRTTALQPRLIVDGQRVKNPYFDRNVAARNVLLANWGAPNDPANYKAVQELLDTGALPQGGQVG